MVLIYLFIVIDLFKICVFKKEEFHCCGELNENLKKFSTEVHALTFSIFFSQNFFFEFAVFACVFLFFK